MMRGLSPRRGITYVDVLIVVGVLVLLVPVVLVMLTPSRTRCGGSNRVKCASNLKQIGLAILLYSNENRGAYPRTIAEQPMEGRPPAPVWGTPYEGNKHLVPPDKAEFTANPFVTDDSTDEADRALIRFRPAPNDVTASLFLLLRTQDITSEVFICPSSAQERFDYGGGARRAVSWTNWPGNEGLRKHLGYSYQNPFPSFEAIKQGFKLNNSISAEFTVASDLNPGVSGTDDNVLLPTSSSSSKHQKFANSNNHDGDGQNVLFGDGHVEFHVSPFVGAHGDNIFANHLGAVVASPRREWEDSGLLPTDD